jgi:fatty-acyl-CoA synthase
MTETRICLQVPFYHCFGSVAGILSAGLSQATLVLPSESFNAVASLEAIRDEKCSFIYGEKNIYYR